MDIREKLVELLGKNARCPKEVSNCHDCPYWADDVGCYEDEATADMLIANGVTVQEWIPVSERLPEDGEAVIIWVTSYMELGWYDADVAAWKSEYVNDYEGDVTHWMPLPQPPKGE